MQFSRAFFDPNEDRPSSDPANVRAFDLPDKKRSVYLYDDRLVLAINVALATRRPLLLAGEPGCGKTTLARNVALVLDWSYYQHTITSRAQSSDLVWEFDALRRLNDANTRTKRLLKDGFYINPGPLWWALAPDTAASRGLDADDAARDELKLSDPGQPPGRNGAVLLIDELDKAEPELPNDLLEVVDARSFAVRNRNISATRHDVLLIFSTNGERDFPEAFMRRCVTYRFPDREPDWYVEVAKHWVPELQPSLATAVATRLIRCRKEAIDGGVRPPGVAEFLDALKAMARLGVTYADGKPLDAQSAEWKELEKLVFLKSQALSTP